jgi:hypothetical protein
MPTRSRDGRRRAADIFIATAAFPFCVLMVAMVLLPWAWPDMATFLPRHMH